MSLKVSEEGGVALSGLSTFLRDFANRTYFPFLDEKRFRVMRSTKEREGAGVWSCRCRRPPRPCCCSRGVGPQVSDQERSMTSGLNEKWHASLARWFTIEKQFIGVFPISCSSRSPISLFTCLTRPTWSERRQPRRSRGRPTGNSFFVHRRRDS